MSKLVLETENGPQQRNTKQQARTTENALLYSAPRFPNHVPVGNPFFKNRPVESPGKKPL